MKDLKKDRATTQSNKKEQKGTSRDDKTGNSSKKRGYDTSGLDEIHLKELEEATRHCEAKDIIQLKQLELEKGKQDAKRRKMELDAQ